MSEDSMPSKRMVLEQQLSELSDEMARLAAAKDAEIAALKAELDAATATFDDEQAAHQDTLRLWQQAKAEIAALTEQRDALEADFQNASDQADAWCGKFCSLQSTVNGLTEQRDRWHQNCLSEQDERVKCEAALRAKDQAMSVLFGRLRAAGVDCSDLIS